MADDVSAAVKPVAFIRERRTEERRGRWETRCDYTSEIGTIGPLLICDRTTGHKGMHTGRLLIGKHVIGYGKVVWT